MAASGEGRGGCETAAGRLEPAWNGLARADVFGASLFDRIGTALRSGTHLYSIMWGSARTSGPAGTMTRARSPA